MSQSRGGAPGLPRRIRATEDLIDLVKASRKAQGLTCEALGEKAGIAYHNVHNWPYLKLGPSLGTVLLVLRALGVELIAVPQEQLWAVTRPVHQIIHSMGGGRQEE